MTSNGLMFPKPRPRALEKADRRKAIEARDERESAKVKARSGGICEVVEVSKGGPWHCFARARHVHHLMGGIGVRAIGDSALAANKVHCCPSCHSDIHSHVLVPLGGVRFERIK